MHIIFIIHRLFGITSLVQTDCSSTWKFFATPQRNWYHFTNPVVLLGLYYTLATLIRLWLQEPVVSVIFYSLFIFIDP